jgi:MFS family permease
VDIYDILLFIVVRKASLQSLGIPDEAMLTIGQQLMNWQMFGLLLGGVLWGVLGDTRGRLSVLFGSIVLYSVANLANGFVETIWQYQMLRLIAGIGLAGELGAGVSIVCESLSPKARGWGTMIVASVGFLGAVAASIVGMSFDWRTAYIIGGSMGLVLLVLRFAVYESGLYDKLRQHGDIRRGSLGQLFSSREKIVRFGKCVLVGLPTYFIVGILVTYAPEFGKALKIEPIPVAGTAVMICYMAMALGDVVCSTLSQWFHSRRLALAVFLTIALVSILAFLYLPTGSLWGFYALCSAAGFSVGFWALVTTNAAEQFGTNLRATVTTMVPNLIRGALIPITFAFDFFKLHLGLIDSAAVVGTATVAIALVALYFTEETFGKTMDFVER